MISDMKQIEPATKKQRQRTDDVKRQAQPGRKEVKSSSNLV